MEKTKANIGLFENSIKILKEHFTSFIFVTLLFLIIYTFLYGFWKIPFINFGINRMAAIKLLDWLFVLLISLLTSIFLVLFKYEKASKLSSNSATGSVGVGFAGFLSAVCPTCQGIVLAAFGTTLLNIPTGFLVPYLGVLKIISLGSLFLAVFLKAESIHTNTCGFCAIPKKKETKKSTSSPLRKSKVTLLILTVLTILLFINQLLIPRVVGVGVIGSGATLNLGSFQYGPKTTLKPMPLAAGEQPKISGYKTIVKTLPTISELITKPSTGDAVQDLLNNLIPSGTPWYGAEAGVSFDDPITAQNLWARGEAIQLDAAQNERWSRIVNSFTCDYCCGSPQQPTLITRCGCAHASAAKGIAKFFIKNYGEKYSDEEIYGEIARWYALWYPKGTIERIIQESQ